MKKIISILIAGIACLVLLCTAASALTMGDVDGDGAVKAADARMALRASVGLEKLTDEQIKLADADSDGVIKAADARLILRASVGLEALHVHSFTGTVTTEPTCVTEGVKTFTCECGNGTYTEPIAKTEHKFNNGLTTKAPTCKEAGERTRTCINNCGTTKTESIAKVDHKYDKGTVTKEATCVKEGSKLFTCTYGCGKTKTETLAKAAHKYTYKVTKQATCTTDGTREISCSTCSFSKKEAIKAQHQFSKVGLTTETKCTAAGCNVVIPAFNTIVNELKSTQNDLNYITVIQEDIANTDKAEIGGIIADMMAEEENVATSETVYEPLLVDRLITRNNFHSKGYDYVSALEEKDVKSITIEKAEGVSFTKKLPDTFVSGKSAYDITAIKNYIFPDVYKITITLPSTKTDMKNAPTGSSVYDKIYMKNFNNMVSEVCGEISSTFNVLEGELSQLDAFISMKSSGSLTSSLVVEYYIDASDFTPVAAKYQQMFDVNFDVKVTDKIGLTKYLTMAQKLNMTSNSYYFFNNNFGIIL